MNKIKITFEIKSEHKNEKRTSKLEKLVNAFIRFWKVTLVSNLRPDAKFKLLRLIIVLIALTYLLCRIFAIVLNLI